MVISHPPHWYPTQVEIDIKAIFSVLLPTNHCLFLTLYINLVLCLT